MDEQWNHDAAHGRHGTPEDVANLVRFLLSDHGQWINGQLLYSNRGFPKGRLPL
jgi:3-oxoacyl-[acyl-carrier protein] reductase